MELIRRPTIQEKKLIQFLIKRTWARIPENWEIELLVSPMDDGGMGSLLLYPQGKIINDRVFGEQISSFQFTDLDGVEVIVSLNVDKDGNLFELDIWKTNFGNLLSIPNL